MQWPVIIVAGLVGIALGISKALTLALPYSSR